MAIKFTVVVLTVLAFGHFVTAQTARPPASVDVKTAATQIAAEVRSLVVQARGGIVLDQLYQGVQTLQGIASDLILLLPEPVPKCEAKAVIKMAAAGTGSHEVLSVLLAEDTMSVLNGRLALSLEFLEQVVVLMEDELSLSDDVGGHLSAIVFGANTTAKIVNTADKTTQTMIAQLRGSVHNNPFFYNRRRRQAGFDLGNGFSVGSSGLGWKSSSGSTTVSVKPTFSGLKPTGVQGSASWTSDKTPWGSQGSTSLNIGGGVGPGGNWNVGAGVRINF